MTDATLVARLQRNDHAAYDALVAQYGDVLYSYLYQSTLDRKRSEALLNATFARVVEQIDGYPTGLSMVVWLYRIAHTVLRDANIAPPHRACESRHVITMLDALSIEERQVIVLRCIAALSLHEVGYVLGKSNAAVRQLQFQAMQAFHAWRR